MSTKNLKSEIEKKFGVSYFESNLKIIVKPKKDDLYFYTAYIGQHKLYIKFGDCVFWLSDDLSSAHLNRGKTKIKSKHFAVVIRGYMPENKTSGLYTKTYLPYINGCSTKQIFPPERIGDPTLQVLDIPPYSSEKAHHIHSTVRIVYVFSGKGKCIVGMKNKFITENLYPGKIVLLQKMCPHHFETDDGHLILFPLHIYSSPGMQESNHPMNTGTHAT